MEAAIIIIGLILIIIGIIGCIIPGIPGPPIAFIALILLQFAEATPFTWSFMLAWFSIVIVVTLLDFYVPIWGTKKFGGSKYGTYGSIVGLLLGLLIPPWGIIIGPFLGAYSGELIAGKHNDDALRAGFGAFVGFVAGTLMKLVVSFLIAYYFISESWGLISSWFV
ncbi:MAG: DUF456 domain-containing protein [Bacteroidales bacterium]|nr:DUF456 domain-containing protein [Bacteroidales bacterium]